MADSRQGHSITARQCRSPAGCQKMTVWEDTVPKPRDNKEEKLGEFGGEYVRYEEYQAY